MFVPFSGKVTLEKIAEASKELFGVGLTVARIKKHVANSQLKKNHFYRDQIEWLKDDVARYSDYFIA